MSITPISSTLSAQTCVPLHSSCSTGLSDDSSLSSLSRSPSPPPGQAAMFPSQSSLFSRPPLPSPPPRQDAISPQSPWSHATRPRRKKTTTTKGNRLFQIQTRSSPLTPSTLDTHSPSTPRSESKPSSQSRRHRSDRKRPNQVPIPSTQGIAPSTQTAASPPWKSLLHHRRDCMIWCTCANFTGNHNPSVRAPPHLPEHVLDRESQHAPVSHVRTSATWPLVSADSVPAVSSPQSDDDDDDDDEISGPGEVLDGAIIAGLAAVRAHARDIIPHDEENQVFLDTETTSISLEFSGHTYPSSFSALDVAAVKTVYAALRSAHVPDYSPAELPYAEVSAHFPPALSTRQDGLMNTTERGMQLRRADKHNLEAALALSCLREERRVERVGLMRGGGENGK